VIQLELYQRSLHIIRSFLVRHGEKIENENGGKFLYRLWYCTLMYNCTYRMWYCTPMYNCTYRMCTVHWCTIVPTECGTVHWCTIVPTECGTVYLWTIVHIVLLYIGVELYSVRSVALRNSFNVKLKQYLLPVKFGCSPEHLSCFGSLWYRMKVGKSHTRHKSICALQRLRLQLTIFIHEWHYSLLGTGDCHWHQV
jgi:hypothetical protein